MSRPVQIRSLAVLALAGLVGGCTHLRIPSSDDIITGMGLPKRGFVTDALFPADDATVTPVAMAADRCTPQACPQAAQYCAARGYHEGTDGFDRCMVSVRQNLLKR